MKLLDDRAYLEPPDSEAKPALKCYFCDADIYEGDDYYVLNGFDCCEECLDVHFKFTAELPDYLPHVDCRIFLAFEVYF